MATYGVIDQGVFTDIADAIREKNGASDTYKPGEMAAAITAITTGGTSTATTASEVSEGVNFLDYNGTCLYSYSWDEIAELTELPDPPTWTAGTDYGISIEMTCTGWNYSLEDIQSYSGDLLYVSATYEPADGKTHLIVHMGIQDNLKLYLETSTDENAVLIDWGDGSSEYTTAADATVYTHEYENEEAGYYDVTIEAAEGTFSFYGSSAFGAVYQSFSTGSSYYEHRRRTAQLAGLYGGTGLTSVESYAFQHCYCLIQVTLPTGLTSIGSYAYQYCYNLEQISIPDGPTSIGAYTFYGSSLSQIIMPASLTSIGGYTLASASRLRQIAMPEGLTSIDSYAFRSCYLMKRITLPESLTSIGTYAFQYCYGLVQVIMLGDTTKFSTYTFQYCSNLYSIDGLYIKATVSNAFAYCYRLTELTNVHYIGYSVTFSYCPLSYQSVINLFNALDEESAGTLTLSSDSYALLSDDDLAIATDKGWTVTA